MKEEGVGEGGGGSGWRRIVWKSRREWVKDECMGRRGSG